MPHLHNLDGSLKRLRKEQRRLSRKQYDKKTRRKGRL